MLVEKRLTGWQIYSSGGGGDNPSPSSLWLLWPPVGQANEHSEGFSLPSAIPHCEQSGTVLGHLHQPVFPLASLGEHALSVITVWLSEIKST